LRTRRSSRKRLPKSAQCAQSVGWAPRRSPSRHRGRGIPRLNPVGYASAEMRRPLPREVVEALSLVLKGMRAWSDGEGNRLPAHSVNVLLVLGLAPEGAGFADVRKACNFGQSRTSRLIAALVRAGLVCLSTPQNDKRRTHVALTPRGLRAFDRIADAIRS
jgi:predicted transcriptional regulator